MCVCIILCCCLFIFRVSYKAEYEKERKASDLERKSSELARTVSALEPSSEVDRSAP